MPKIFCYNIVCLLIINILFGQNNGFYSSLNSAIKEKELVINLNLSKTNLKEFPEQILKMTNIQTLDLSQNSINCLPENIDTLQKLKCLNLGGNQINYLPKAIANIALDSLILWGCKIKEIGFTKPNYNLKYLDLRAVQYSKKQKQILINLFPNAKIRIDHSCNCG